MHKIVNIKHNIPSYTDGADVFLSVSGLINMFAEAGLENYIQIKRLIETFETIKELEE